MRVKCSVSNHPTEIKKKKNRRRRRKKKIKRRKSKRRKRKKRKRKRKPKRNQNLDHVVEIRRRLREVDLHHLLLHLISYLNIVYWFLFRVVLRILIN